MNVVSAEADNVTPVKGPLTPPKAPAMQRLLRPSLLTKKPIHPAFPRKQVQVLVPAEKSPADRQTDTFFLSRYFEKKHPVLVISS